MFYFDHYFVQKSTIVLIQTLLRSELKEEFLFIEKVTEPP